MLLSVLLLLPRVSSLLAMWKEQIYMCPHHRDRPGSDVELSSRRVHLAANSLLTLYELALAPFIGNRCLALFIICLFV